MSTIRVKRTTVANRAPDSLALGELALGFGDVPIKMWAGTPTGVQQLFAGEAVEDAEDDTVYGRCNGDWVPVPFVGPAPPVDPAPNMLWCDSTMMLLFVYFNGQWVEIAQ